MGLLDSFLSGIDNFKRKTAKNIWDAVTNPSDFANMTAARMQEDRYGGPEEAYAMKQYLSQQPYDKEALKRANEALARNAVNESLGAVTVWHGSPHKFNKFDMSKIGTGEGAQAYGHGLYMAESPQVAEGYFKNLGGSSLRPTESAIGKFKNEWDDLNRQISDANKDLMLQTGQKRQQALDKYNKLSERQSSLYKQMIDAESEASGAMYKVDIPDEAVSRFLDWDKPLSEQAPEVLKKARAAVDSIQGKGFYDEYAGGGADLRDLLYNLDEVPAGGFEDLFKQQGIPGIRYLDGGSRSAGQGSSNYVLFDDQMPRILEINGQPTGLQPWQQGEWQGLLGR